VLSDRTEVATEQYNASRIRLAVIHRAATTARRRSGEADAAVRTAGQRRATFGLSAYRASGLEEVAVLLSGDPQTTLDRAGALQAIGRRQQEAETALRLARRDRSAARTAADAADADERASLGRLTRQKKDLESSIGRQRTLVGQLLARQAELIRQARIRAAAARAARERLAAAARLRALSSSRTDWLRQAGLLSDASRRFSGSPLGPGWGGVGPLGGGGAPVAVRAAYALLGRPYVWAAAGPQAFDCSGLTQWVWARAGVALSHYTGLQWNEGRKVGRGELAPGDLVFFGRDLHHVGIYIGSGLMINAPHTGAVVRVEPVWWTRYAGAVRPTG
jgi:cell wall-associated NlpC family hydrolase